jgi:MYXO-CTERM domain-containing protein
VPPNWSYPVPGGVGGVSGGETGNPLPTPGDRPSGTGGTTGIGGGTVGKDGEAPPAAPGTGATADRVEGGCQVGSGSSASSGFGILAALGLAGLLRRRNRSAA